MRTVKTLAAACLLIILSAALAHAHGVRIFGYVENGFIKGEGYFGRGVKAQGALVELLDASGTLLATAKTDQAGAFAVKLPQAAPPLKLVLKAGPGHQGEYTLTAADLGAPAGKPTPASSATPATPAKQDQPAPAAGVSQAQLEQAVARILDQKLAPINRRLAELTDKQGVTTQDIVSGIGYILGLFGIAAYMMSRRKEDR